MSVGEWLPARVAESTRSTAHARVLKLDVDGWMGNAPGQHVDVRLTAEDGYQAVRSYSMASFGPDTTIELGVDEVADGEVSPYLVREVRAGDELEVKGPLGGYFVWRPGARAPVQLIAGGSGIVPLVSIMRARAHETSGPPFRLLYSVRNPDAMYRDEIDRRVAASEIDVTWVYTRQAPEGWTGRVGRIDADVIAATTWERALAPDVFVCGPTAFVELAADVLVSLGHDPRRIKTERFGGS